MEKVLEEYREGKFNYESGSLEFSCPRLELSLQRGQIAEGSFTVWSNEKRPIRGYVMSESRRMQCQPACFEEHTAVINYRFDASGLLEGEVVKGEIHVITSQGEYSLPYVASVEHPCMESSMGAIKNLFHFANLAKTNWEEAVKLFYTPRFREIFQGSDRQYLVAYQGFLTPYLSESNVEEFLLEIHKKQPVEYLTEQDEIVLHEPQNRQNDAQGVLRASVVIQRNGWGYTRLAVSADGAFLCPEKETLEEKDFASNRCELFYSLDTGKLHAGNNYGCILLENVYQTIRIPVTVSSRADHRTFLRSGIQKRQYTLHLMEHYLAMRLGKISTQTWMRETETIIGEWSSVEQKNMACKLFQAQLLMAQKRYNEAHWLLDHTPDLKKEVAKDPELYCYYLYLNTLDEEDKSKVRLIADRMQDVFARYPDRWRIGWLLLYADEEYEKSASRKWMLLEELFYKNCVSPLIYLEAAELLKQNPALLVKLKGFEIQTLYFMAKKGMLTEEVIRQIHYMAGRMKYFSRRMFFVLQTCYEQLQDDESLQAVCTQLIQGGRTDRESFAWYRLGVERELHITRLYEYFMMSIAEDYGEEIPKRVLLYFVYRSSLDYQKKAFLYAYVVRNEPRYPELYRTYLPDMEQFVREQIVKQHVNRNLIYLYKKLLTRQMLQEYANEMMPLLFTRKITTDNPHMKRVVVRYAGKLTESFYPLADGAAYLPLLGEEYRVFLEDGSNNRYREGVSYETDRMLSAGAAIREAQPYVNRYTDFDLYVCRNGRQDMSVERGNEDNARRLAENEEISRPFRCSLLTGLAEYYFKEDNMYLLDGLLERLEPETFSAEERAALIRLMVLREQQDKAHDWIVRYGAEGVEPKTILRFLSRALMEYGLYDRPEMGEIACQVFKKGKYNEAALQYLMQYYRGATRQLRDIWRAAREFEMQMQKFDERLLLQMMFAGTYLAEDIEIFQDYLSCGAAPEVEEAFLIHVAFQYFVKRRIVDEAVFPEIARICARSDKLPPVVRLAWLKWLSGRQSEMNEQQTQTAKQYIAALTGENIYYAFFQEFKNLGAATNRLQDKTILEYHADPESRVTLHYLTEDGLNDRDEYCKEEMRHMYGGAFVKPFVLFFGEKLQYYITEKSEDKEQLTESGALSNSELGREQRENRYTMLNDIVTALTLQDFETVDEMMKEYGQTDFLVHKLFKIQ